ncbi:MAG: hypothetical protein ACRD68_10470, partial [Pyrinomonadaceae bacterium]
MKLSVMLFTLAACLSPVTARAQATAYGGRGPGLTLVWMRLGDINGEAGAIEGAEFSPDNRFIVTGSKYDNQLIMWRTIDGAVVWQHTLDAEI